MLVKVTETLKTFDGKTMKDGDGQGNMIDATLKLAVVNALLAPIKGQESGVEKVKKYELARKVYQNDEVELSAEDISLIKSRIGDMFPALVVGQCFEMLEGK